MSIMRAKKWFSVTFVSLATLATFCLCLAPPTEAATKKYKATVSSQQKHRNTGINSVLSPNLSCSKTEKNNDVTKGALYGAGSGLLVGGPVGAVVGAGAGAVIQQEQNKDACRKR